LAFYTSVYEADCYYPASAAYVAKTADGEWEMYASFGDKGVAVPRWVALEHALDLVFREVSARFVEGAPDVAEGDALPGIYGNRIGSSKILPGVCGGQ
jgi:hypothetical protein